MSPVPDALLGGGNKPSYRGLFAISGYRKWFISSLISSLGDWIGFVALPILAASFYEAGSRPALFALGGVMMTRLLPSAFFGPVSGVLADRYDRRKLIVATDVTRALLYVAIAFTQDLLALLAITFVIECVSLLFMAARDAALPSVVDAEHLPQANQLNLLVAYGTLPLGAVATTALLALTGALSQVLGSDVDPVRFALVLDGLSYVVSAVMMAQVKIPKGRRQTVREQSEDPPGIAAELREGLAFIRSYPLIRSLIVGVVGVFFGAGIVIALGPEFVRADLGQPEAAWSVLITLVGVGLVLGIVGVVPLLNRYHIARERSFPVCLGLTGLLSASLAFAPSFLVTEIIGFLLGIGAGASVVIGYTLLQEHTEDDTRARTFATFYTATRLALFAALGFGPFIAGAIGRVTMGVGGSFMGVSGIRVAILGGGLVALFYGLRVRRGVNASEGERPMRLDVEQPAHRSGTFVVFEGVEGSGKSTQLRLLAEQLRAEGLDVVETREPGGSPTAERVRAILLDPASEGMTDRTETLLYAAARAEHVEKVIQPALGADRVVLCDRYVESSLAYQGHGRGLGPEDIAEVNRWATAGVLPDVVVLLRLDPVVGLRRVEERARRNRTEQSRRGTVEPSGVLRLPPIIEQVASDRLEREGLAFHQRVAQGYLDLARQAKGRHIVVDATGDPEVVARQIRAGLHQWLPLPADAADAAGAARAADRETLDLGGRGTGTPS